MFSSKPLQPSGAWDRNNPRLPGEQPGERDLSRCRLLPFCDRREQINHGLIRLPSIRIEARDVVAHIGTVECGAFVDLAGQKALTQRAIWNKADSEFLERRDYFRFRPSPPQRIFALYGSDRLDGVRATDRLGSLLPTCRSV